MNATGVSLGIYEKALMRTRQWRAFFGQVVTAGFSFVDLSVDETQERAARLRWSAAERSAVREAARAEGVQIGAVCLSLHRKVMPGSADPEVRRQARDVYHQGIELAADLGASILQVAGYFAYYEPSDPDARQRYVDTLLEAVPHAARTGVVLGIENVDGHDLASIGDAMTVVREAASPWVQLYPDVGNIAEHGGDATAELAEGQGHMLAIHVKDVLPGHPRRIPFGAGVADFDAAFAELYRQRWSGRMMLEMWNEDAADSVVTCVQARCFVEAKLHRAGLTVVNERLQGAGRAS